MLLGGEVGWGGARQGGTKRRGVPRERRLSCKARPLKFGGIDAKTAP